VIKWPGREADNFLPSSSEVNNERKYNSSPLLCVHGMSFVTLRF
jgi:hypothetical protein